MYNALIRPISARSSVVEQRVTQDFTPSFCRVEEGTARDFCENLTTNCGSAPRRGCRRLSIYDSSNERRNEGLSIAPDPLRQQRDLNKDWPVFLRVPRIWCDQFSSSAHLAKWRLHGDVSSPSHGPLVPGSAFLDNNSDLWCKWAHYCARPAQRSKFWNRGSERRLSRSGSIFNDTKSISRSWQLLASHCNARSFWSNPA